MKDQAKIIREMTINRSVEFRARASNRRVKNQATPKTLILERGCCWGSFC